MIVVFDVQDKIYLEIFVQYARENDLVFEDIPVKEIVTNNEYNLSQINQILNN